MHWVLAVAKLRVQKFSSGVMASCRTHCFVHVLSTTGGHDVDVGFCVTLPIILIMNTEYPIW